MLAAHRDQENLAHSHHKATAKQQHKTPGIRHPKAPALLGKNDENATITTVRKNAAGHAANVGANGRLTAGKTTGKRLAMMTPMESRARAPLGNKTTNAKARTSQSIGAKSVAKEINKSRTKQTVVPRTRQRPPLTFEPLKINIKPDSNENDDDSLCSDPEYAPPIPEPLPYESDTLPQRGFAFKDLKREKLLKDLYGHFQDHVVGNNANRTKKRSNEEMGALVREADDTNATEIGPLTWHPEDVAENA